MSRQQSFLAKALDRMRHGARPSFIGQALKRTRYDYRREVGDCLDASVVTAPVQWLQRALPEARLVLTKRQGDGSSDEQQGHPLIALLRKPNPFYGDTALWAGTVLSFAIAGNAYWLKVRNGNGKVAELWYVPHWLIEPKFPQDGSEFITHYAYKPGGGAAPVDIDPEDVIHFRHGIDPRNTRLGLSPIDGAIREIFMDLESSNFVASLLRNMGVPGVVISPKNGVAVSSEDVEATKTWFNQAFGGDRRGSALVMGAPTDVSPYGFNPSQMNMSEARDVAEERVCACLGIPAAVVGFGAGLQSTKVGATMLELRKLAWHNGVLPIARQLADELGRSLLPDFAKPGELASLELGWDTDAVLALQEDEDKQAERWGKQLGSGGITVYEYRQGIGLEADDSHRIYLRPINLLEVPEGAQARVPTPPPPKSGTKAQASEAALARGEAYALMLERQQSGLSKSFEAVLNSLFTRLGAAAGLAAASLLKAKGRKGALRDASGGAPQGDRKSDESLIDLVLQKLGIDAWNAELTQAYNAHYLTVADGVQDAAERAGLGTSLPDPVARAIVASGGRRAGLYDLDTQTRAALFDALAEGRAEGEGIGALANRIEDLVGAGQWSTAEIRARIVARSETKYAQNISTIERSRAAGVTSFIVFDGRLGLPRSTLSHIARNGSIVDAAAAEAMAAAEHPNGTLSFAPNFAGE